MSIKCPNPRCPNPSNIQCFSMAHKTGVANSRNSTVGMIRDSDGDMMHGLAITKSQSLSHLAIETAPPERNAGFGCLAWVLAVFGLIVVFSWSAVVADWNRNNEFGEIDYSNRKKLISYAALFTLISFGVFVFLIKSDNQSTKEEEVKYKKQMKAWRESWVCLSCGNRWRQR